MQRDIQKELDANLAGRDQELTGLRLKLKEWSESLLQKDEVLSNNRAEIRELKLKVSALEESKLSLKKTLQESHTEL